MKVRFEVATLAHAKIVADNMRERDYREVVAGWGKEPFSAIAQCLRESHRYARTCFYGLEPLAIFGLSGLTILGESAQVWCFGTKSIDRHPLVFVRASIRALEELHSYAAVLTNYIDSRDYDAARWLAFLGASYVLQPERRGGRLFEQFVIAKPKGAKCRQV